VWYLFIWVDKKEVALVKGSTIIEKNREPPTTKVRQQVQTIAATIIDMDNGQLTKTIFIKLFREVLELMKIGVLEGILTFFDYGELFKSTTKFGNITSRPRPNWSLNVTCESTRTLP
jgi:hypothetical protein